MQYCNRTGNVGSSAGNGMFSSRSLVGCGGRERGTLRQDAIRTSERENLCQAEDRPHSRERPCKLL